VGGGVRNRLLCQMTADACRRPVVAGPVEAAALGNLLAQAAATGHLSSLAQGADALSAAENLLVYQPQCPDRWQQAAEHLARIQSLRDTSLSDREKI
jgi:sugar (pentulose or hexulose) kinase